MLRHISNEVSFCILLCVYIYLQLAWSSMNQVQQFGRSCRANQVSAPHYVLAMTDIAGENRFAATIASRLEQLGALTRGDRRAKGSNDLSSYTFEGKPGEEALKALYLALLDNAPHKVTDVKFLERIGRQADEEAALAVPAAASVGAGGSDSQQHALSDSQQESGGAADGSSSSASALVVRSASSGAGAGAGSSSSSSSAAAAGSSGAAAAPTSFLGGDDLLRRFPDLAEFSAAARGWLVDGDLAWITRPEGQMYAYGGGGSRDEGLSVFEALMASRRVKHSKQQPGADRPQWPAKWDDVWWVGKGVSDATAARLTSYLRTQWLTEQVAALKAPHYGPALSAAAEEERRKKAQRMEDELARLRLTLPPETLSLPRLAGSLPIMLRAKTGDVFAGPLCDANNRASMVRTPTPGLPTQLPYPAVGLEVAGKDKNSQNKNRIDFRRFANRLNMLPLADQAALFAYFQATFEATVKEMRAGGQLESGIVSLKGATVSGQQPPSAAASAAPAAAEAQPQDGSPSSAAAAAPAPAPAPSSSSGRPKDREVIAAQSLLGVSADQSTTEYRYFRMDKGLPWYEALVLLATVHPIAGGPAAVAAIRAHAAAEREAGRAAAAAAARKKADREQALKAAGRGGSGGKGGGGKWLSAGGRGKQTRLAIPRKSAKSSTSKGDDEGKDEGDGDFDEEEEDDDAGSMADFIANSDEEEEEEGDSDDDEDEEDEIEEDDEEDSERETDDEEEDKEEASGDEAETEEGAASGAKGRRSSSAARRSSSRGSKARGRGKGKAGGKGKGAEGRRKTAAKKGGKGRAAAAGGGGGGGEGGKRKSAAGKGRRKAKKGSDDDEEEEEEDEEDAEQGEKELLDEEEEEEEGDAEMENAAAPEGSGDDPAASPATAASSSSASSLLGKRSRDSAAEAAASADVSNKLSRDEASPDVTGAKQAQQQGKTSEEGGDDDVDLGPDSDDSDEEDDVVIPSAAKKRTSAAQPAAAAAAPAGGGGGGGGALTRRLAQGGDGKPTNAATAAAAAGGAKAEGDKTAAPGASGSGAGAAAGGTDVTDLIKRLLAADFNNKTMGFWRLREDPDKRPTEWNAAIFLVIPERIVSHDAAAASGGAVGAPGSSGGSASVGGGGGKDKQQKAGGAGKGSGKDLALGAAAGRLPTNLLIYRAEAGRIFLAGDRRLTAPQLLNRYMRITNPVTARNLWQAAYDRAARSCRHGAGCSTGNSCQLGKRIQEFHIITGAMLPVWAELSSIVQRVHEANGGWRLVNEKRVPTRAQLRVVHVETHAEEEEGEEAGGGKAKSAEGTLLGLVLPVKIAATVLKELKAKFKHTLAPAPPPAAITDVSPAVAAAAGFGAVPPSSSSAVAAAPPFPRASDAGASGSDDDDKEDEDGEEEGDEPMTGKVPLAAGAGGHGAPAAAYTPLGPSLSALAGSASAPPSSAQQALPTPALTSGSGGSGSVAGPAWGMPSTSALQATASSRLLSASAAPPPAPAPAPAAAAAKPPAAAAGSAGEEENVIDLCDSD